MGPAQIGLASFVPREDAARILQLRDALTAALFGEVRDLANYSLHAFVIPESYVRIRTKATGAVLPLPDPLPGRLTLAQEFTFDQARNVGTYADHLWEAYAGSLTEF